MNILDQIPEGWELDEINKCFSEYNCYLIQSGEPFDQWVHGNASTPDEALKLACDKAREYNIQHLISENTKLTKPCKSPYCECDVGKCTHPGFHDARGE